MVVVFLGWHMPGLALPDIVALWVALAAMVFLFWSAAPLAGVLMVPYLLWVSFASTINASVWRMNPTG